MPIAPFWINGTTLPGAARSPTSFAFRPAPARRAGEFETRSASVDEMTTLAPEWAALAERGAEPNGFFEPGFALAAARHFPARMRPIFIIVWRCAPTGERRLVGLLPIFAPGLLSGFVAARGWLHEQAALATPLLDRDCSEAIAAAMLDGLAGAMRAGAVILPKMPMDGPVFSAFLGAARATGRDWRVMDCHARAALLPAAAPRALDRLEATKEQRRRQRRFEEAGAPRLRAYSTLAEILSATEAFLALEASGWKAGRGALLDRAGNATFARAATRQLARDGKMRIHSLELDERPIAMALVIESGRRAYFWKSAYDERLRVHSPGVRLASALAASFCARRDVDLVDSCAIAGHPMIERCWLDRVRVGDLMIQTRARAKRRFVLAHGLELWRRRLRALAKAAYHRLRAGRGRAR